MEKENDQLNQLIKNKVDRETLEISSTGYGLESVSHDTKEKAPKDQNPSTCGGL